MTLSDLGAINNDDRNVYCDSLNLSYVTKSYFETQTTNYSAPGNGICTLLCAVGPH
jgi:hypothetical protein